ncbi:MAG: hypothetical protein ACLU9S_16250 [Oscillospiraceae bacterium]
MKDYMDAVKAAGIFERTPQLAQDALIEMLEELSPGKSTTANRAENR